jgi:Flp pilus assembly protein TadG
MNIRARLRREDGAAAVEFALIVGVLAMLIFGMLQFGVAFFELQNLRAATREGARVGAVKGTVADITGRVSSLTGVASFGTSLRVYRNTSTTSTPTFVQVTTATDKPCVGTTGTQPQSVKTAIVLADGQLPASLQNIFTVDIPLVPSINLRTATVYGEFRCEN